ncbi:MAG: polyphosphate polymerase domain-containing protein [Lachnospiraceae bacterium]|nr:polyphosphate polymerase domain-containing protein [Lachnospiraceae bacterium]
MDEQGNLYRYEWKFLIHEEQADLLQRKLTPFLSEDVHASDGGYQIRSLYFDDLKNSAYTQKLMGVYARKKWRIRIYNFSDDKIALERKTKRGNYIFKESADLTHAEFDKIMDHDYGFLYEREERLCREFYIECIANLHRPKVIVDYYRTPLTMEEGTVRITFDRDISAAVGGFDIFDAALPRLPAQQPGTVVLEVKYTEYLPQLIRSLLPTEHQAFTAYSKYCACFEAAHHIADPTAGISKTNHWQCKVQ